MDSQSNIDCFLVSQQDDGHNAGTVASITYDQLPEGDLLVESNYSSLNYKDALASIGHRGIVKRLPHIPGIDLVGTVRESQDNRYPVGSQVLMGGSGFGTDRWGGWSKYIRLKADEVMALPSGISAREAMSLGTAGFTAAQCIRSLLAHQVHPAAGEIIVSGATGGVGTLAIMMLNKIGFKTCAVTGKTDQHAWLRELGADHVIDRQELLAENKKPLLTGRWAGGVDTVGGDLLSVILKQTLPRGCVTACGMAASNDLQTTVFPFILRGVTLAGIDSAGCPIGERQEIWQQLAENWVPQRLNALVTEISLSEIKRYTEEMLAGQAHGRVVLKF
jgi:putative YhdH/YhfP family quinone oxidoreductase